MARQEPPALPPRDGDAPLHELTRDRLSVLLYAALTGPELAKVVKSLRISVPGYRTERFSDPERADVLADEIRAVPDVRKDVLAIFREVYEFPALDGVELPPVVAGELAALAVEEDALVRILWRILADPSPEVRASATPALDALVKTLYGPIEGAGGEAAPPPQGKAARGAAAGPDANAAKEAARLRKDAERATAEAARSKERLEELKTELKAFRSDLAAAQQEAKTVRAENERLAKRLAKAEESARAAKVKTGRGELDRARKQAADAEDERAALLDRERRVTAERDELRRELDGLRRQLESAERRTKAEPAVAAPSDAAADALAEDEVPSTWSLPRFSREFYDSLRGRDVHLQRLAFKQAWLLAENHRHPSLRAIPLEGLPGYFRVRIASDIRLIYRRADRDVEILSLIDRDDLDRYVRQAKTR